MHNYKKKKNMWFIKRVLFVDIFCKKVHAKGMNTRTFSLHFTRSCCSQNKEKGLPD